MEEVNDVIEMVEEVSGSEKLGSLSNPVVLVCGGLTFLAVGAFIGYKVAEKRLTTKFDQLMKQELAETRAFYNRVHKTEFPTPADAVAALVPETETLKDAADAILVYRGETDEPVVETRNVFVDSVDPTWDQEKEERDRTETAPYILHHDEFMAAETSYNQITITWYEGDNVLSDEEDKPIDLVEEVVGHDNLQFGHGSGDENIVYIRNDRLEIDFEVTRSEGKYAHEVLGFEEELKHSSEGIRGGYKVRRFREERE